MKVLMVGSRNLEKYCKCPPACLKNALNISHFKQASLTGRLQTIE